jgi:hypothetical protein
MSNPILSNILPWDGDGEEISLRFDNKETITFENTEKYNQLLRNDNRPHRGSGRGRPKYHQEFAVKYLKNFLGQELPDDYLDEMLKLDYIPVNKK